MSPFLSKSMQRESFRYQRWQPSHLPDPSLCFVKSGFPIHFICICYSKTTVCFVIVAEFSQYSAFSYFHRGLTTCRWILTTSLQTSHVDSNTICNYVIYIRRGKPRKVNVPMLLTEFFLHHAILFLCAERKYSMVIKELNQISLDHISDIELSFGCQILSTLLHFEHPWSYQHSSPLFGFSTYLTSRLVGCRRGKRESNTF